MPLATALCLLIGPLTLPAEASALPVVAVNDTLRWPVFWSPVVLDPLANDVAPAGVAGLTVIGGPLHGYAAVVGSGAGARISYSPSPGSFSETDELDYRVTDLDGNADDAHISLSRNNPPFAVGDLVTAYSAGVTFDPTINDYDIDGDPVSVTRVGPAAHGTVAATGNAITYVPLPGYYGSDTFTYDISDGYDEAWSAGVLVEPGQPVVRLPPAVMPPGPTPVYPVVTPTLSATFPPDVVPVGAPVWMAAAIVPLPYPPTLTATLRRKTPGGWAVVATSTPSTITFWRFQVPTRTSGTSTWDVQVSGPSTDTVATAEATLRVIDAQVTDVVPDRAEHIVLTNTGRAPFNLAGMTLRDRNGRKLVLPRRLLRVDRSIALYTGRGTNTRGRLYLGNRRALDVWSRHDVVRMFTADGFRVVRLRY